MRKTTVKRTGQSAEAFLEEVIPALEGAADLPGVFQLIDRDKILRWEAQPRDHITAEMVTAKRDSISEGFQKNKGLGGTGIESFLIVRYPDDIKLRAQGFVVLVDGELRWRGTEPVKRDIPLPKQLPCDVRDITEAEAWEIAGVTGVQRREYTAVQEARIVSRFMQGQNKEKRAMSVRETAERFGKPKSWVSDLLIVADPDDDAPAEAKAVIADLQKMVSERSDTLIHARELKKVADRTLRQALIRRVIDEKLSLEKLREIINPKPEVSERSDSGPAAPTGQTSGSGFDSGGSSSGGSSSGTTSRSHESGLAQTKPKDIITGFVKPATSFVAEAKRRVQNEAFSDEYKFKLRAEIVLLKSNINDLEEALDDA